ncbi:MAG: hypothetical protein IT373_31510 [Polyangiaceae bacterium]|nr:hypothetical protein [Polyangiaceae bacterium]
MRHLPAGVHPPLTRVGDTWRTTDYRAGERVALSAPAVAFEVDAVYRALAGLTGAAS